MRRAIEKMLPATPLGASWLSQQILGSVVRNQGVLRCPGEASTSYGGICKELKACASTRGLSGKAAAKGKAVAASASPPAPEPESKSPISVLTSAGARLRRRQPGPDPLTLLTPQQMQLAEQLAQRPAPPPTLEAADSSTAVGKPAVAATEAPLHGLGQLGLPLGPRDISSLLHQSLSGAVHQNVQFQPFVFSNIFQSASAAAAYVAAAIESGANWSRVERFFLAAVEVDSIVGAVRVAVSGRMGVKADMASTKVWEWGDMSLRALSNRLDYGMATSNTKLGAVGVKVWIRYKTGAIKDVFFPPKGGSHYRALPAAGAVPTMSLDQLYTAAVNSHSTPLPLPYNFSSVGWWERSAVEQPPENRVSELFVPGFDPSAGDRLDLYFRRRREESRRFRSVAERRVYMASIGRFLAKQHRMEKFKGTGSKLQMQAAEGGAMDGLTLGRRPNRVLGKYRLEAFARKRLEGSILRFRLEEGKGAAEKVAASSLKINA